MRLAVSNIAWDVHDDTSVLDLLIKNDVSGVEIAPTKLWKEWGGASYKEANKYKNTLQGLGLKIPTLQAILFGKPELQLFEPTTHKAFLEHIRLVADLASGFESQVIVFGAPKNRKRNQMSHLNAMEIAADFFNKAGDVCAEYDCCIGLEHNPVEYGCDFITNLHDARDLVDKVGHHNFKLHLDSAGIHMCGGDISEMIKKAGPFVHYHISEPMLEPIHSGEVDQKAGIDALNDIGYEGWVSIEMKQPNSNLLLQKSLEYVKQINS